MVKGVAKVKKPSVSVLSRVYLLFHAAPVFVWLLIGSLKLLLEFLFHILRTPFGPKTATADGLSFVEQLGVAARLFALPLVSVGLLGSVIVAFELLVDVLPSKSKPAFAMRSRLHRMINLSASSAGASGLTRNTARLCALTLFFALPVALLAAAAGGAFVYWHRACAQCPLGLVCQCSGEHCQLICEWALKLTAASVLVLVQLAYALATTRAEVAQRPVDPFDALFAAFDADFSGVINERELMQILGVDAKRAKDLLKQFDADGDREIDMTEFRALAANAKASGKLRAVASGGATDSVWSRVVQSPLAWTRLMACLLRAFVASTLLLLVGIAGVAGARAGAPYVLESFLVVSALNVLLLGVTWMAVLYADQLLELTMMRAPLRYVASFGIVPLVLALVPEFRTWLCGSLLAAAVLNSHGLLIRQRQAQVGSRSGSNALRVAQRVLALVFAGMAGLFLLSTAQVLLDARGNLPDAFGVRDVSPGALSLHTIIGGVSVARGNMTLLEPGAAKRAPDVRFATCHAAVHGISVQEAVLLAQMAYLGCKSTDLRDFRAALFPDFDVVGGCDRQAHHAGSVVFLHLRHRKSRLNVVAIRGTHVMDLMDWVQDVELWIEPVMFSVFEHVFAGLKAWPLSLIADTIHVLSLQIHGSLAGDTPHRLYYQGVYEYVRALDAQNTLVVGHSLGGGLAKIVGAKARCPAIAISGPGIVEGRHKFGVTIEDINRYVVNLVPSNDVVPQLGTLGGTVHHIVCAPGRPDLCHQPMLAACHLQQMCDNAAGSRLRSCDFTYDVAIDMQ